MDRGSLSAPYRVLEADFADERVINLLRLHTDFCHSPDHTSGKVYALDLSALQQIDVKLWTIWDRDFQHALGCVALKKFRPDSDGASPTVGEIKSMHVVSTARGSGVSTTLLDHVVAEAQRLGWTKLYLETGTSDAFSPARALYRKHGFLPCGPFGDYVEDDNIFMSRDLTS